MEGDRSAAILFFCDRMFERLIWLVKVRHCRVLLTVTTIITVCNVRRMKSIYTIRTQADVVLGIQEPYFFYKFITVSIVLICF